MGMGKREGVKGGGCWRGQRGGSAREIKEEGAGVDRGDGGGVVWAGAFNLKKMKKSYQTKEVKPHFAPIYTNVLWARSLNSQFSKPAFFFKRDATK